MEQTQFSTIVGDFQLQVSIKDSHCLYLHAHHLQNKCQFHLELDNASIIQTSNHIFTDVQSMAQALQDAANKAFPNSQLSLDKNGTLTYSARTPQRRFSFPFSLIKEEVPVEPKSTVELLEKELEKMKLQHMEELRSIRLEYEGKIAKLEQIILQEQEEKRKIKAEYEEKFSKILHNDVNPGPLKNQLPPGQLCFRRDTPSASHCEFSDNDKTAKLIKWEKSESFLRCYPQVPDTGKHTFALKVNNISRFISFGITTKESGEFYFGDPGCYCYLIKDGRLITREIQSKDKIEEAGDKDSIVEMTVDLDVRALVFYVDGKQVRSCKLKMEDDYNVFVGFGSLEDSVTLL